VFTLTAVNHMTHSRETETEVSMSLKIVYNASFKINGYLVLVIPV